MDDLIYFQDDAGNEIGLVMITSFKFENRDYALFATPDSSEDSGVYVMRMDDKDGELNFTMPEDEELDKLTPVIMEMLEQESGCTHDCCSCHGCHDEGCDCEHDECDCDHDDCDCGCHDN